MSSGASAANEGPESVVELLKAPSAAAKLPAPAPPVDAAAALEARLSGPSSSALARRFDLYLLAPLTFLYFICYLDRSNLANAKAPVQAALQLTDTQYALASSIFQVRGARARPTRAAARARARVHFSAAARLFRWVTLRARCRPTLC